jgi:hypothetical protein
MFFWTKATNLNSLELNRLLKKENWLEKAGSNNLIKFEIIWDMLTRYFDLRQSLTTRTLIIILIRKSNLKMICSVFTLKKILGFMKEATNLTAQTSHTLLIFNIALFNYQLSMYSTPMKNYNAITKPVILLYFGRKS